MGVIEQAVELIRRMSRRDKAHLLAIVAGDPDVQFPGISVTAGVCGGAPRVMGTRIPVWLLEGLRQDGVSDQKLVQAYPQLTTQKLADAWAFVEQNRELIDQEIAENESDTEAA
jgi:uncharacterized protein (DUF433 family)